MNEPIFHVCACCKAPVTESQWYLLSPPANGVTVALGCLWRNCACGGTMCVELPEVDEIEGLDRTA